MRYCDQCHTTYPNDFTVCPRDQSVLRVTSELVQGMHLRGKYEILDKIGSGGMASVYKARHLAFNEVRAIKVVSSRFSDDEVFLKRFKNEAIITRKLQHPNAVRVDDLDVTDDGRPFIVMEFVEGRDLRRVVHDEGPLPVARVLDIGKQLVSAVGAAHALGITHRDIKPDNILLIPQPDGSELVKVLDFGIAKVREGAFDLGASATKTGVVVGTPQYLSPEQAQGKHGAEIDGRADIYSLGVVLYEMLTGRLPLESDTPIGILIKHIQTMPTPAHELRPELGIPKPLSMILMKAMQKDRNDRFQSAAEMLEAMNHPEQWAASARIGVASATGRDDRTAALGSDFLANIRLAPARVPTPSPQNAPAVPTPAAARPVPAISPVQPVEPETAPPAPPARPQRPSPAAAPPRRSNYVPPPSTGHRWVWVAVVVLVIAAAAAGGGYWYLHERQVAAQAQAPAPSPSAAVTPAPAPVSNPAMDQRMRDDIRTALDVLRGYQKVQVTVEAGVVTLSGSVRDAALVDQAGRAAAAEPGVQEVRNNISIEAERPAAPATAARAARQEPPAPRGPTPQQRRLRELVASGERSTSAGDYAAAIAAYQSALEIDPNDPSAQSGLRRAQQAEQTEMEILRRRK